ncbi:MAG: DNA methyltransferase [Sphingomonas sp.]
MSMQIEMRNPRELRPYDRNARTHSRRQIEQLARSIRRFGFTNPVLISDGGEIVAGHGRVEAAKTIGLAQVPTVRLSHLGEVERRAYVLADNKLALEAGWDQDLLAAELGGLLELDWDIELTGFSIAETDLILDMAQARKPDQALDDDDVVPDPPEAPVCRIGDVWHLGRHRLVCGDARSDEPYRAFADDRPFDLIFTDPPYNVPIQGHVCGLGRVKHREFAMAAGEMSRVEFTTFLATTLGLAATRLRDGAIAFVCMDWRHMGELLHAGELAFDEFKQLCVWNKSNAGMGAFYRSKHELVFVYKVGAAPHLNNFGLGGTGRYRTNVWDYPGISSATGTRAGELAMHPTVKPVRMVIDAIEDCSRRGDIVLDCFAGSGTTLIAAERCGRLARVIEYDPAYCDTIIQRYRAATGRVATLGAGGPTFDAVADARRPLERVA